MGLVGLEDKGEPVKGWLPILVTDIFFLGLDGLEDEGEPVEDWWPILVTDTFFWGLGGLVKVEDKEVLESSDFNNTNEDLLCRFNIFRFC